ncbi:hypothetical protein [Paenibacillus sp. JJ-223]|uniref:hypothetical protein n=1 Tax=Paenibacillus sp. JJ-223 TaxID=2905647 RepID=UPI001F1943C3|nr:hypothetical protein [Paenibacillus sp. JJ-223]CAH1221749.1 hypothetical protein PAECIP111890_05279 [Paenibacillus sp. JJ-223]
MKIKTMSSIGILVLAGSLLMPIYAVYDAAGYIIASISSVLIACLCYFVVGAMEERRTELQKVNAQIHREMQDSKQQLVEYMDKFTASSKDVQSEWLQAAKDMKAYQQGSLLQLEDAKNQMLSIAADQQTQAKQLALQLEQFTSRMVSLFEGRLKEEFEAIQATRTMTGEALAALEAEVSQSKEQQDIYLGKLERVYIDTTNQWMLNQKDWADFVKQHMSEVKLVIEDMLDDTKAAVEDIMKSQRKDIREVLGEIQEYQESVLKELAGQGRLQQSNLEILQRLQEEILDLNQQDMKLISRLMEKV